LGDGLVGLADDSSALFFNPAGLGKLQSATLSINHNSYLAGTFEETLLFGMPAGPLGGFGAALQYVGWGSLDQRDVNGVPLGSFSDSDVSLSLGWGHEVARDFSLGLALHATQQKIVDSLYTDLSGDVGALWTPSRDIRAGLAFTGLSTSINGSTLAQDLHAGLSVRFHLNQGASVLSMLAGYWEPNGVSKLQGGLEGDLEGHYFLRVGYQGALTDNQIGGLTGLTAGAGLKLGTVSLDYAFVPYGDLGTSHRVSLGYEFPNPTPVVPKPVTVIAPVTVLIAPLPTPTPLPTTGPPKSKVEVHFELPGTSATPETNSETTTQLQAYEAAAQKNPQDSRAWRSLGVAYFKAGKTTLAIQCLEQALRLNPNDTALKRWLDDYRAKHPQQP
jgi:hypothetical protein